jgi:hypothetical protein
MNKKLKIAALAMMAAASAVTAQAQDSLVQAVSVGLTFYSQGTPVVHSSGVTNNVVVKQSFGTKDLIKAITGAAPGRGDILARVTPTEVVVNVTNLVPVSTNTLVITNISTSLAISNAFILNGVSNYIGNTNVTFGTNIVVIGGIPVTLGTNAAIIATPAGISNFLGTNTTVTSTSLTNSTNYAFVANTLNVTTVTNKTGKGSWVIYNTSTKTSTPIPTNVYFDIHTAVVYHSPTNLAYVHGETIKHNGEIEFGSTDEIRTLVLSNATMQIRLAGFASGHLVPVSLGRTVTSPVVDSQDYHWSGEGSGLVSNSVPTVISGNVQEGYFKLLQ